MKSTLVLRITLVFVCLLNFASCSNGQGQERSNEIDKKIGQMLLIGFRGMEVDATSAIAADIKAGRVGGVILFDYDVQLKVADRNIKNPAQVTKLVGDLQNFSQVPLFIAIDQEGGRVNRLKSKYGFPKSVSAAYLGKINNLDSTAYYTNITAETLNQLGINLNFSPVVDLNINPDNPVIGKIERSFNADYRVVAEHASTVIAQHKKWNIINSLKHFPGHGSAWNDSHFGIADVSETWKEEELLPYRQLISQNKVDMVMTAHIFNNQLDPKFPATLSKKIITGVLREKLGFSGVIVSDDMQMDAIDEQYGLEAAVSRAIEAGVDILVFGNNLNYDPTITQKAIKIIKTLIEQGKISEARINESYERIQKLKKKFLE